MLRFIVALATIAVLLVPDSDSRANETTSYKVVEEGGAQLRDEFNRAKGSIRLLFVVDPVCPGCLRGLDDVNNALLAQTEDPRLQTFVVHVPVIGAEAKDVGPATELLQNSHVRHYWNPSGSFGRELAEAARLEHDGEPVYAWDVWLIYGPEATWDGPLPPQPRILMHQLYALDGSSQFPHLDGEVFAQEVHRLLAQLPPEVRPR
jgi:hypothetical protein